MPAATLYVRLLDEGTAVSRPVSAIEIEPGLYRLLQPANYDPEDEHWEFPPGTVVRAQPSKTGEGDLILLAVSA